MVGSSTRISSGTWCLAKSCNDAIAEGRFDDVGDEDFLAQVGDVDAAALGEAVARRNDEGQFVAENFDGGELWLLGNEGDHAEIEAVVQQLGGNVAREGAAHGQAHVGILAAITHQNRQQGVDGAFVDAEGELAACRRSAGPDGALDLLAEIEHALGVAGQELAGVGELAGAGAAREEGLADPFLELADGDADGGLGAKELLRGAGEAAFAGDGEEDVEFGEVHAEARGEAL